MPDANTPAPPAHANEPSAIEKALNILPQFQSNGILPFEQIASDARAELAAMHAELRSARQDSKRLDWMDKCELSALSHTIGLMADGNNARQAIDASTTGRRRGDDSAIRA